MAIRTFNSVAGFSVGEIPVNIISNIGEITSPANATVTGTIQANTALRTDSLLHIDGTPWDFQQPAGAANGQIQYYSNGDFGASANLSFTASNNYFYVGGDANVTGNITAGNITAVSEIHASDIYGNFYGPIIGDITAPGGSGANTYVVFNDNGTMNAVSGFTFDKVTSALSIGTGNLTVGNTTQTNARVTTLTQGRILLSGANGAIVDSSTLTFSSGNLIVTGNANVTGNTVIGGDTAITGNASAANVTVSSLTSGRLVVASTGGKLTDSTGLTYSAGNLGLTGNIIATGNISGVDETLSGNLTATGNVSGNNATFSGNATVTGNVSGNNATFSGNATVTGNISGANETLTGNLAVTNINANGAVTGADFYGTFHGPISGDITAPGGAGANTYVVFNDGGLMNAVSSYTFNKVTSALSIGTGNLTAGNISTGLITGTLTTNAQPNITSVGTLTSMTTTGNANVTHTVNTGNLNVTARVISSLIPSSDNTYDLGTNLLQWKNVFAGTSLYVGGTSAYIQAIGNVIQTDAANIANGLSTQTLTVRGSATLQDDLTISGNLTVGGSTTYINVTNTSIQDPLIDLGGAGNGANATSYDGKDRGLILHNYKSDDSGAVNEAFIWKTANSEFQAIANVTDVTGEIVTGALGNIRASTIIANVSGQILTASQTNITTVGTLTNLTVAGNTTTSNATVTGTFKASGLTYPGTDGTAAQVLSTYGNGQLYFTTIDTYKIANGTSNVTVNNGGNVTVTAGGNTSLVVTSTGANVSGTLNVTGNTTLTNTRVDNLTITSFYPNGTASVNSSSIKSATTTTASTTANLAIAIVPSTGIRGVEFFVKGEDSAGAKYSVATVSAVHNGTSVDYAVYGTVNLPANDSTGKIVVNYSSGNIRLEVTPASSNTTVWTTQYRTI